MSDDSPAIDARLRALTAARVGLGRTGASLPTRAMLDFAMDHARARDAVHRPLDAEGLAQTLEAQGLFTLLVDSAAPDRITYLARPDLGRRLGASSRAALEATGGGACDLAIVLADGLSSQALGQAPALLDHLSPMIRAAGWRLAPVVIARQARVALGDEAGDLLAAGMVLVLIGERPGLSSPDSLGAYLTQAPRPGRSDAERNCVSNIRPQGLAFAEAAHRLMWLMTEARRLGATGVALKDESDLAPAQVAGADSARLSAGYTSPRIG